MTESASDNGAMIRNVRNIDTWKRLVLAVLFAVVHSVLRVVVGIVFVVQFGSTLLTGNRNDRLNDFAIKLTDYIFQIVSYITFRSDVRPFPFSDWPGTDQA